MHCAAKVWLSGSIVAASLLMAGGVQAAPAGTFMPQSFLGEAAAVAFAFSLPALVAGIYLVMERLWVGIQRRVGMAVAAVGLVAIGAVAAVGVLGGNASGWGGNWIVLARS